MVKSLRFGRGQNNDVVINDPAVSDIHCQITLDDSGSFYINDLNSSNGTYVNGTLVQGSAWLNQGDEVRIGSTLLPWMSYFTNDPRIVPPPPRPNTPYPNNPYPNTPYQNYPYQDYSQQRNPFDEPSMQRPNSHLGLAIAGTIFCWPFGIPAIVNAAKVNYLWNDGRYEESIQKARKAKSWETTSLVLGIIGTVLYSILMIASEVLEAGF